MDGTTSVNGLDLESCYRAVRSRDRRFDGIFYTAVSSTGIYCRPSCPARTPALVNVSFHRTAAAAQAAGYRACKRCRPDATPGSPEWDVAASLAGRAMRLIADGVVDREGVEGLAHRVGYSPRHLTRLLTTELGAGPLALARARRAQTARTLVETTELGFADIAFAAGFSSVRQFNDTVREVYAASPTDLRGRRGARRHADGTIALRLAVRTPFAGRALHAFLRDHLVPGVEAAGVAEGRRWFARTLDLPNGPGTLRIELTDIPAGETGFVHATFELADLRDTTAAVERARRLLDADCDPLAVADVFADDPVIGPLAAALPGLRVAGTVDGGELALRTIVGQQVSVAGARTVLAGMVAEHGRPIATGIDGLTHLFPAAETLAAADPAGLPMPRARGRAVTGLASALAAGELQLDRGTDRDVVHEQLMSQPGVGPWTADYVALRALGHPDIFLPTDLGIKRALDVLDAADADPAAWRPWRSYALLYLWTSLTAVEEL
ncbi:DNA-3-methyladenine glycosylase II [Nocardioides albertanoniae]|uniref:DNA-3-methyladenine glycosylase II n=1 Tax=Nocardioides albertanoniae TaxID=1175486 RepID=A0A543AA49_9ACTN|nr:Ada metal-binding domain-containing protein [Nocardioides albertanoniae]TQL69482.1 DNA-3-methyladenine glycosylase II [Nocardioides albertanoniae]